MPSDALTEATSMHDEIRAALATAGLRPSSTTADFEVEPLVTLAHSYVARIHLAQINGQSSTVIFKRSAPGGAADLAQREARFYRGVVPLLPADLTPNCLLAMETADSATLLLQDLTATHSELTDSSPTQEQATAFVEALADLHAGGSRITGLSDVWASNIGGAP